ncbi:MAG: phosphoribosylformylglycinamidine synthase subunit PurL [Candidatus Omnitrophica bacterium]|nr:phosphoribosylformylglycinamidine synthase subunit PurL [Candidatus Omnitrophota bacterium]
MIWRVEVQYKKKIIDPEGAGILKGIHDLGIRDVCAVRMAQVYLFEGELAEADVARICDVLLCDPVIQEYRFGSLADAKFRQSAGRGIHGVEIAYNPGVMDPWEESTSKGIRDLGIKGLSSVKTGKLFLIAGEVSEKQLTTIAEKLLFNKIIQHRVRIEDLERTLNAHKEIGYQFKKITAEILGKTPDELTALSKQWQLSLSRDEMVVIQQHFAAQGRNPTDCELETIAQTWSEHCMHKTMRGTIDFTDTTKKSRKPQRIVNLLKSTIMAATEELNKPWCVSVFRDNAGIVRFDSAQHICFKVETHNHPSALDPYGGAGTGIGGVIRDILGVGLGAKPILNTDVFCFGPPDTPAAALPAGTLHPKRIMKGVVAGVRDYGNRMGIPTANGAVIFDTRYIGNPLVFCGTVGIMPKSASFGKASAGEYVVVIGGRTGRDGIHGATFSSLELSHESETVSNGAVQIGNAITEKKVLDVLLQARDKGYFSAVTDCGAGGLSSAVGEMGAAAGVRVDLEKVPLKYRGLSYTEIWISEAQERMVLAVPPKKLKALLELLARENVDAAVIGRFTETKRLQLFMQGECVGDIDMHFLHKGVPAVVRRAVWKPPRIRPVRRKEPAALTKALCAVLGDLNVCSKEGIIRQYDHEVQGMSVLKPLAGARNDGPQDAAVLRPRPDSARGIAVACGINSRFGEIDPYWMAAAVIEEALRQIVCVGGLLSRTAILDNFSWGNTARPECLGELVRACFGCYDAAVAFDVPFISGKDSLNNEYAAGGRTISIPPTLLISALSVVENVEAVVSADAKRAGNLIYVAGKTYDEMGGSAYFVVQGWRDPALPRVRFAQSRKTLEQVSAAVRAGVVSSCHDCSEGGLAVALAEMAFAGDLGMEVDARKIPQQLSGPARRDDVLLFSESNSRFVLEVAPEKCTELRRWLRGVPHACIGRVAGQDFVVSGMDQKPVVRADIQTLRQAWQQPLRW